MDAQPRPLDPPQLFFDSNISRRRIIISYWVIILLAVPIWWRVTSIDRLPLPTSRVAVQEGREIIFPVTVQLSANGSETTERVHALATEAQRVLDAHSDVQQVNGIRISVSSETKPSEYQVVLNSRSDGHTVQGRRLLFETSPESTERALAEVLTSLIAPYSQSWHSQNQSQRVMRYAPRYRLAFTMLNEDAASGVSAAGWDIEESIAKHLKPVLDRLSMLHNFTLESQVQFHAPLAFTTRHLDINGAREHGLTQEDLTVFVNSAEWTLSSSVSNDPVLHFVLFIPSSKHTPLRILNSDGSPSTSNAFILPQWGGIVLLNLRSSDTKPPHLTSHELDPIFSAFRHQLMTLLGVPPLTNHIQASGADLVTDWQLDALLRRRALENVEGAKSTLQGIIRLVHQIDGMPVGPDVQGDVEGAIEALDAAFLAANSSATDAFHHSKDASTLSSEAFFNPSMLALLYFPAEHKYAVYAPLFASVAVPLVVAVLREIMSWRRERREKMEGKRSVQEHAVEIVKEKLD